MLTHTRPLSYCPATQTSALPTAGDAIATKATGAAANAVTAAAAADYDRKL